MIKVCAVGSAKLAWTGRSKKAPCTSSRMPLAIWALSIPLRLSASSGRREKIVPLPSFAYDIITSFLRIKMTWLSNDES